MARELDDTVVGRLLHRRSFVRIAVAILASIKCGAVSAETAARAGSVEDIKGEGFAEAGTARRMLDRDAPLFIADRIGTGPASRLTLQLGRQTRVRLGELARLTIDRYLVDAGGEFTLGAGPMLFERAPGRRPSPVQIRSAFGLIAVRGTRLFAGPSAGVFGVFVERGTVVVSGGGRRVTLQEGQGTDIRQPGDPPTPAKSWGPQRIRDALASVS